MLLDRVLRGHVEFIGHLVTEIAVQVVVKRLVVAADAASYAGCMGGEHRSDGRHLMLEIENAHTRGPFVEMSHSIASQRTEMLEETFDHQCGSMCKGASFIIVAIADHRIDTIPLPHLTIEGILCCI